MALLWKRPGTEKKKNYLILRATCYNSFIDKARRKFVNFIYQTLSESFCSPRKKYFRPSHREINKDEVVQGKFVAWPFHFSSKPKLSTLSTSTFHLYILSVHYWPYKKKDFLNLTELYRAGFSLACTNGQMVDG